MLWVRGFAYSSVLLFVLNGCSQKKPEYKEKSSENTVETKSSTATSTSGNAVQGEKFETTLNLPQLTKNEKMMLVSASGNTPSVISGNPSAVLDTKIKFSSSCANKRVLASGEKVEKFAIKFFLLNSNVNDQNPYGQIVMNDEVHITNECAAVKAQLSGLIKDSKYRLVIELHWIDSTTDENGLVYFGASNYFTPSVDKVVIELQSTDQCMNTCAIKPLDPGNPPPPPPPAKVVDLVATLVTTDSGYTNGVTNSTKISYDIERDGKLTMRTDLGGGNIKEYAIGKIELKYMTKMVYEAGSLTPDELIPPVGNHPVCADGPAMKAYVKNAKNELVLISGEVNCQKHSRKDGKQYKFDSLIWALRSFAFFGENTGDIPGWTGNEEAALTYEESGGFKPDNAPLTEKHSLLENGKVRYYAKFGDGKEIVEDIATIERAVVGNAMYGAKLFTAVELKPTTNDVVCADAPTVKYWVQNNDKMVEVRRNADCLTYVRTDSKTYQYEAMIYGLNAFSRLVR